MFLAVRRLGGGVHRLIRKCGTLSATMTELSNCVWITDKAVCLDGGLGDEEDA